MFKLLLISIIIIFVSIGIGEANKKPHIYERTIRKQKQVNNSEFRALVDYFRPQDAADYTFSYQINSENYRYGGPLFFYINDAGVYTTDWIEHGLMYDIAVEVGAILVTAYHRYYGNNMPVSTASWDDLSYLTIEQAIGDIAFLIAEIKEDLQFPFEQCVVWGTGYGGILSVWSKQKYPHLIDGAWSSSGVYNRISYTPAYYKYMGEIIRLHGGDQCAENVENAFDIINAIIDTADPNELIALQQNLNLCDPVNTASIGEVGGFFESVVNFLGGYIADNNYAGINSLCNAMNVLNDPFESFVRWLRFSTLLDVRPCLNLNYNDRVYWNSYEGLNIPEQYQGWRQNLYLICTQLGLFRITDNDSIFGQRITQEYHDTVCQDAFGDNIDMEQLGRNIDRLDIMHGGDDPSIPHVIFTSGMLDPFFPLGINENDEEDSISIVIPSVGRSADLHSISIGDATTLYSAKNLIRERIIEWVDVIDDEVEIEDENIEEIETLIIRAGRKPRAGQTIFKT